MKALGVAIALLASFAAKFANADDFEGAQLLDFRLTQISMIQDHGNAFSAAASWNPRYVLGLGMSLGADVGLSALKLQDSVPGPVLDYQGAVGFAVQGGFGLELTAGRQLWFSQGKNYDVLGANALYVFERSRLGALDRVVVGYEGLSMDSVYTNVLRIGVGFRLDAPRPALAREVAREPFGGPPQAACGVAPFSAVFFARPLTEDELRQKRSLPYLRDKRAPRPVAELQLGQMSGLAYGAVPYVKDAQTVFAIDVSGLPSYESVQKLEQASLELNVSKVSKDGAPGSEVLCLLDEKICSGQLVARAKAGGVNPKFFAGWNEPRNENFSKRYLERKVRSPSGESVFAAQVSLPLEKIAENYPIGPMEILYGKNPAAAAQKRRTIYLVVADDTFVSADAKLEVRMTQDTCSP
jgi:hypothetical protein